MVVSGAENCVMEKGSVYARGCVLSGGCGQID